MDSEFSELVRRRRSQLGLSQARLAELVGRSASAVRAWERGSSRPNDPALVSALAAILGVDEATVRESVDLAVEADAPPRAEDALELLFDAEEDDQAAWEALSAQVTGRPPPEFRHGSETTFQRGLSGIASEEGRPFLSSQEDEAGSDLSARSTDNEVDDPGSVASQPVSNVTEPEFPDAVPAEEPLPGEDTSTPEPAVEEPPPAPAEWHPLVPALARPVEAPARPREPIHVETEALAAVAAEVPAAGAPGPGHASLAGSLVDEAAPTRLASTATRIVPAVPPGEPSYLEDPKQLATYWVRTALTVAIGLLLLIVFIWAMGKLGDSLSGVWELFKASS